MTRERVLVVGRYPPERDGIAAYTLQLVRCLAQDGARVDVCSPVPSAAQFCVDPSSPRGALALGRLLRRYDRVSVQFQPELVWGSAGPRSGAIVSALLSLSFRAAGDVELRLHEAPYNTAGLRGTWAWSMRGMFRAARRIAVHTEWERTRAIKAFGVEPDRVDVVPHGEAFTHFAWMDRRAARARLGLPADDSVFVCIGFIQPHKGFDRAVRAFAAAGLPETQARLDIVGSVRIDDAEVASHVAELRTLTELTPHAHLHEGYVSDADFDAWLIAADCVVLPYRSIWSSGVLERARLHGTRVIATDVGGLQGQGYAQATFVGDDRELADVMRALAVSEPDSEVEEDWPFDADLSAIQSSVERRATTVRGAPLIPLGRGDTQRTVDLGVPPISLPVPRARGRLSRALQGFVSRVTRWELEPLADRLNELQRSQQDLARVIGRATGPDEKVRVVSREPGNVDASTTSDARMLPG